MTIRENNTPGGDTIPLTADDIRDAVNTRVPTNRRIANIPEQDFGVCPFQINGTMGTPEPYPFHFRFRHGVASLTVYDADPYSDNEPQRVAIDDVLPPGVLADGMFSDGGEVVKAFVRLVDKLDKEALARIEKDKSDQVRLDEFNAAFPVGTRVRYWPGSRGDGPGIVSTIRHPATLLGGHTPVVWMARGGAIALSHVERAEPDR